ncbi:MAG: hypothetical protein DCC49_08815 [Acidobacteria bacterium]|nr:MAG: hypothetical protein DCC49_08815 [Acidobacteriota bacterium]
MGGGQGGDARGGARQGGDARGGARQGGDAGGGAGQGGGESGDSQGETIRLWRSGLDANGVPSDEIDERVAVVLEFAAYVESTPDEIVETCIDNEAGKVRVKERKRFEAAINEFAPGSVEKANVVRSFLIHNGVRLVAPRASWL